MTAQAVTTAVRDAIAAGHRHFTVGAQVGRIKGAFPADVIAWHLDKSKQDLYRQAGIELLLTPEELDARYQFAQEGPFSAQWEEDEDGNQVKVPLGRADYCGYILSLYPRRQPLPGAVYVARQPIEGEAFDIPGLQRAFNAVVDAHGDEPQELRLSHRDYADFCNLLVGMRRYIASGEGGDGVTFNGVRLNPQRRAPLLTLLAVYPLPGIGA
jgi:hypothetical protein